MHPVFWLPLDFKFKSILPGLGGVYSPYRNMFWIKHQLPVSKTFEFDEHSGICSTSSKSQAHIMSQDHISAFSEL